MSDLRIVGMVLLSVCLICITILIREVLVIQAKEKRQAIRDAQKRADTRDERFHDTHEALWLEEKAKRISAEQEIANLKKEIQRMENTMGKVKIGKIKEYRNADTVR